MPRATASRTWLPYVVILLLAAAFGGWLIQDPALHPWDERYHALVGKNLLVHPFRPTLYDQPILPYDYHHWSRNHVWVHKPPVALYAIAASLKVFGVTTWAVRLPSLLALLGAAGIGSWLAGKLFGRTVARLTLGLFAFHGLHLELVAGRTATDHVDVWLSFFTVAGAAAAFRYYASERSAKGALLLTGACLGLGLLSKSLPALLILVVATGWAYRWSVGLRSWLADMAVLLLAGLTVATPWYAYIFWAFPEEAAWSFTHQFLHFSEGLGKHAQPWYFHLTHVGYVYGQGVFLPLAYALWSWWQQRSTKAGKTQLALLGWIALPYLVFSLATTKMIAYPIQAALPLFILISLFIQINFRKNWMSKIICLALLLLPLRYTIERSRILMTEERTDYLVQEPETFDRSFPPNTIVFGTAYPVEAMFHHEIVAAYEQVPSLATLDSLTAAGYQLIVIDR